MVFLGGVVGWLVGKGGGRCGGGEMDVSRFDAKFLSGFSKGVQRWKREICLLHTYLWTMLTQRNDQLVLCLLFVLHSVCTMSFLVDLLSFDFERWCIYGSVFFVLVGFVLVSNW